MIQGLICIPGAVTCGKDEVIGPYLFPVVYYNRLHLAIMNVETCGFGFETYLAAKGYELLPHVYDNTPEPVGTNMGFGLVEYLLICTCVHKGLQYIRYPGIINPGGELPV